jgi:hypothetical protein
MSHHYHAQRMTSLGIPGHMLLSIADRTLDAVIATGDRVARVHLTKSIGRHDPVGLFRKFIGSAMI